MTTATLEDVELIVSARLADLERRIMPEALTVRDVARRLGFKGTTRVNELIRSGALPSYKIGGARRVDPSDLAAFIAERRSPSPVASSSATAASRPRGGDGGSWLAELRREAYGA